MKEMREEIKQQPLYDEQCWNAVLKRDRAADGSFVFAVRSTGIYCRPSCPARRPRRENVAFYQLPAEAETAGFRPCKRCHPELAQVPVPQAELIEEICSYIEAHLEAPLHLAELSAHFHLSPYHLQRTFKRVKGISPRQYAESCRLGQFKARLQNGEPVTSALYDAGYQSSSSLYGRVPTQLGMTPTAYRQGGKGMHINYDISKTPLGYVLMAATERGVAAVRFGESEKELETELEHEYPQASLVRDGQHIQPWMLLLLHHLQGRPMQQAGVPLDVQASAFQWKVWKALQAIPVGSTRSYGEIAKAIGEPTAARGVARACATNPVAVFIPCHRVIRANGEAGGYHWGVERKQQLLALEKTAAIQEHAGEPELATSR
ncbi:bifunctional DNA-binding transcriptional regulator/O6-methylguanine-DNA methyltransferase Ada [Ktedonosporobacter rubrisoli]|uniref:methylated-DNA--[protein]-cysteine S-methyltransferase n=1 Tax=Ktedonosporobacter rubrisoli TaxID=2509675 RepID=A0A4P6JHM6_KTERU|nr:bifunctional DNA-binding transcriptional regulator/O6-methylguanine-DNA methyltransferase Ada [Ktedonosporobacter rubrisoli]QBD74529.1 bifunctional DNA-binding transcriptional regulator/O6-methylguanine-DNA methyltransferase Ada [Ktedonosporobacter rubrisoli]